MRHRHRGGTTRRQEVPRFKLPHERSATIVGLVRAGNYRHAACHYAGINLAELSAPKLLDDPRSSLGAGPGTLTSLSRAHAEAQAAAVRLR